ncbi:MAG: hypothetical protein KatS3mg062_1189 [Tepidiforma sp.]|nr:MAG: hypothetical protein KatS3mg062_1189 [Tepidiforma sp.]
MRVATIGFTKKSAEQFFGLLRESGARRLVDVRLHNVSQLAGFTKKDDLAYFVRELCGMDYVHLPELAPTEALLDGYRKAKQGWPWYERAFFALLAERRVEERVPRELVDGAVLLCSEATADRCHRRLTAEYFAERWGGLEIVHL